MAGQLILGLSILVTLHEFGHYITAKWFKMRVEKFYLFFDFLFPIPSLLNFALFKKKLDLKIVFMSCSLLKRANRSYKEQITPKNLYNTFLVLRANRSFKEAVSQDFVAIFFMNPTHLGP